MLLGCYIIENTSLIHHYRNIKATSLIFNSENLQSSLILRDFVFKKNVQIYTPPLQSLYVLYGQTMIKLS